MSISKQAAKILIIDDSIAMRTHLGKVLREAGYEVFEAENGSDGLRQLTETAQLDLAIIDFNMPIYNGIEMLQRAKEALGEFKFPVFMMTTETSPEMKLQGKAAGLVAWITKPFSEPKLLHAIETVLSKRH